MQDTPTTPVTRPGDVSALAFQDVATASHYRFDLAQPFDRGHDMRGDAVWLESRLADTTTEFIPVWRLDNLVAGDPPRPVRLGPAQVAAYLPYAQSVTLLGMHDGRASYAIVLPDAL